jgi:hypothetical protein
METARNIQLTHLRARSSHFLYDIPEIFEKRQFYRINFVVDNCKVNIEIEIARDVDNRNAVNSSRGQLVPYFWSTRPQRVNSSIIWSNRPLLLINSSLLCYKSMSLNSSFM